MTLANLGLLLRGRRFFVIDEDRSIRAQGTCRDVHAALEPAREQRPEQTQERGERGARRGASAPPPVRQIYALAAALRESAGEPFPERREDASELIERLRRQIGHPAPRLDDARSSERGRGRRGRRAMAS